MGGGPADSLKNMNLGPLLLVGWNTGGSGEKGRGRFVRMTGERYSGGLGATVVERRRSGGGAL